MAAYNFDEYGGKLYRVFEGTVLEGVVTNHVDGGMAGPGPAHAHHGLLLTRQTKSAPAPGNPAYRLSHGSWEPAATQTRGRVSSRRLPGRVLHRHRQVRWPRSIGTTGLATKVDHGYLQALAAAAAIGGLGGLAQIGNNGGVLTSDGQIRNGISSQTSQEGVQVLNHFLNRLPIITLKEGSRARVYIGKDILIPSYADHRVNPTL